MKKRTTCFLMALLLLLSVCTLFASCKRGAGEITVAEEKVEMDIKGYTLYYAESEQDNSAYKKTVNNFSTSLKAVTGKSYSLKSSQNTELEKDAPAILIGDTGYSESKKAKKAIDGVGFAIHVKENRIAIVGSDELLTIYALQYFMDNYLSKHEGGTVLNIPQKITANELPLVVLADSEGGTLPFVYGSECHEETTHPISLLSGVYAANDMRDAPVVAAAETLKYAMNVTKLKKGKFTVTKDSEEEVAAELLLGHTNRPASAACLSELGVYEYGFFVRDGKMVLSAWNDAQMFTANTMLADLLKLATKTDDEKTTIAFPEGFVCKGRSEGDFVTDFPKPDGISLYHTMDTAEDTLQYVYKGEGVNVAAYRAYVSKLLSNGYTVISENEIEESQFATLVNASEKIMLYVTYNAFAHESEFEHAYDPLIRVVSASTEKVSVPDASVLTKPTSYEKVTNTAVTALEIVGSSVGMCYIITLEDGSFIIFDGGGQGSMNMAEKIWTTLNARYEMIFGKKPQDKDGERIRIAAWIITHSHGDHYGAPSSFLSSYGRNNTWQMDYLIGNYPSASAVSFVADSDITYMSSVQALRQQKQFTFLKVHAGQKYYFANLEIEVLTTYEDLAPARIKNQNDTNTVTRWTLQATEDGIKNGVATNVGDPYTMVWTGDANNQQSRFLCAMYGDYMESDMVQVAHHGNIGSETDFYDCVKAEVVWFPNSLSSFRSYVHQANKNASWVYAVDYRLVHENPWTKYVFVSGGDGQKNQGTRGVDLTLEFGDNGLPAFDDIHYISLANYKSTGDLTRIPLYYHSSLKINDDVESAYKPEHNWE